MAFVPYVSSCCSVSTTVSSSFGKIVPLTTSTDIYSKPVINSYSSNAILVQEHPAEGLEGRKSGASEIPSNLPKHLPQNCSQCSKNYLLSPSECRDAKVSQHKRTHFTLYQRRELEEAFTQTQYISPRDRLELSVRLGIPIEIIQTWFKNRRVKWRKEQRQRQTGAYSHVPSPSAGLYFHYFGHVPYPSSKLMINDARMFYGSATTHAKHEDKD